MRMNQKQFCEAFANVANSTKDLKASNLFSHERYAYSYGYHFPLAIILNYARRVAVVNADKYSKTTSKQRGMMRVALHRAGYTVEEADTKTMKRYIAEGKVS